MRARTGLVTPAPDGAHVEQVGWGVARQVARELRASDAEDGAQVLDRLADEAETPGHLVYVVFERRTAIAAALVELPVGDTAVATYVGDVYLPDLPPGTRVALLVRALHDVALAGAEWLEVAQPAIDLHPLGFR